MYTLYSRSLILWFEKEGVEDKYKINKFPKLRFYIFWVQFEGTHSRDLSKAFNFPKYSGKVKFRNILLIPGTHWNLSTHSFQHKQSLTSAFLRLLYILMLLVSYTKDIGSNRKRTRSVLSRSSNPLPEYAAISAWYFWRTTLGILLIDYKLRDDRPIIPDYHALVPRCLLENAIPAARLSTWRYIRLSRYRLPLRSSRQIHSIFILAREAL